jgi:hypothetical protein
MKLRRSLLGLTCLWLALSAVGPAHACMVTRTKHGVLGMEYSSILVARVVSTRLSGLASWSSAYKPLRAVRGEVPKLARLEQDYNGLICAPYRLLPIPGETYVLYLQPWDGGWEVDGFLRLQEAKRLDPRVRVK